MAEERVFCYRPQCSHPSCNQPALFKLGAVWSDGTSRELKNYGLTCETHRQSQLERARRNRDGLRLAEGETVGSVALFVLEPGRRDTDLAPATDSGSGGKAEL
jgi:hypothetical protein